jgi:hypothetical protein
VGRTCGTNSRRVKMYKDMVGNPEGNRPLGRTRSRWEDGYRDGFWRDWLLGCRIDSVGSG